MGIKQWWNSERLEIIKIGFKINYQKAANCKFITTWLKSETKKRMNINTPLQK